MSKSKIDPVQIRSTRNGLISVNLITLISIILYWCFYLYNNSNPYNLPAGLFRIFLLILSLVLLRYLLVWLMHLHQKAFPFIILSAFTWLMVFASIYAQFNVLSFFITMLGLSIICFDLNYLGRLQPSHLAQSSRSF